MGNTTENKINTPMPPQSKDLREDQSGLKSTYCSAPNVNKQLDKIREKVLLITSAS